MLVDLFENTVVFDHCECWQECDLIRQILNYLDVSKHTELMVTLVRLRVNYIMFEAVARTAQ